MRTQSISLLLLFCMQCITLAKDSTLISIFSHAHPPSLAHPLDSIYKYDFHKSNYVGLGDIISTSTTTLQQNIGEPLIYSGISIFNSSPSTTVLSYNGVQIQDMISGPGDVYGMSPETINKVFNLYRIRCFDSWRFIRCIYLLARKHVFCIKTFFKDLVHTRRL